MPRIRTIKPELFLSETLAQVSLSTERTFTGLITQADDKGRLRYSAAVLNGALWPLRPEHTVADMETDVHDLVRLGVLCRYTGDDGKEYLHFPTWGEHQRISHPSTRNLCPACPVHEDETPEGSGKTPEGSGKTPEGSGKTPEGSGKTPEGKERKGKERITPPINRGGNRGGRKPPSTTPKEKTSPKTSDKEDDMGVYDTNVEAFTDLRASGAIKRKKSPVGKNGLDPKYADDVETVIQHFVEQRKALGVNARPTNKGRTNVQLLLKGDADNGPYTVEQLVDLTTFAHQHHFWNGVIASPESLRKHAARLYASDEYVRWSVDNNRPSGNRPRSTMKTPPGRGRGEKKTLTADRNFPAEAYEDQDL